MIEPKHHEPGFVIPASKWRLVTQPIVSFYLFKKSNPDKPFQLTLQPGNLLESQFNISIETKIILHGFDSNLTKHMFVLIRNAFLSSHLSYNVIGVDWSELAKERYRVAARGVLAVAGRLASLLDHVTQHGVTSQSLHLVAHSLGAHICGVASKMTRSGLVGRITGLDPAAPLFEYIAPGLRLDKSDAHLVEVVHTHLSFLGISRAIGHVDFYPNGGVLQPGCFTYNLYTRSTIFGFPNTPRN